MPKDLEVTLRTGAACWRLYSERSTRRTTCWTRSSGKPFFCGNALRRLVALDVGFEDGIENVVGRQRIGVHLAGAQFGGRRLREDRQRE